MLVWLPDIEGPHIRKIEFFIPGVPRPWQHGRPMKIGNFARIMDSKENRAYKEIVRHHFFKALLKEGLLEEFADPPKCTIMLSVHAFFKAPKEWVGQYPTKGNDQTNLVKMIEDALQLPHPKTLAKWKRYQEKVRGFQAEIAKTYYAFTNDSFIVQGAQSKRYSVDYEGTLVVIDYYDLPKPVKRLRAKEGRAYARRNSCDKVC